MAGNAIFDLPIDEVKNTLKDLMTQIGEEVLVDSVTTKIQLADLEKIYSNLQQNMKRTVFLYDTIVSRGSRIDFKDGRVAIVYNTPNDDIVSKSAQILICNSKPEVFRFGEVYDTDPTSKTFGDIKSQGLTSKGKADGFIERLTAKEKQYDVGLLHDAILRFITFIGTDIMLGDILRYNNKKYKVIDIDDITQGILVVQLANVRE